jgi:hypothetical protein
MLTPGTSDAAGVMYLDVLGMPTIFSGLKSAFDMLERRVSNSSGHPRNVQMRPISEA